MRKNFLAVKTLLLAIALSASSLSARASFADQVTIPQPNAVKDAQGNSIVGATVPYYRYDSHQASIGGGATLKTSPDWDRDNIATQASNQSYVELPVAGAYAEWTLTRDGDGVTLRFTMPDTGDGMGQNGSLDVYVNGVKDQTIDLTSYYMWQYFPGGQPSDSPGGVACFAFDEMHFRLKNKCKAGDKIKIVSTGANGLTYGVDFVEVEIVDNPIEQPAGAVSVTDFGADPNKEDNLEAFVNAVAAADRGSKILYIPEGTWKLGGMWNIYGKDLTITGAGMWHTNIQFTSDQKFGGGISAGNGSNIGAAPNGADDYYQNVELCHFYVNSRLRSRYGEQAVYKCFMDCFNNGSTIHDVWEDHFECGVWIGDYNGAMSTSDGLKIYNSRFRNNLADGVNFCQGASDCVVYNCNLRNNGDDGLAMWNNNYGNVKDESNNIFAYNTIDLGWRAGGIAIYGGTGHKIYNNYLCDMFMASGIHLNTTFPGYKFDNTRGITFDNNILVRCGTGADGWNEDLAAVDVKQSVHDVTFNNTQIYDSPFEAIRIMTGPSNVVFNDTKVLGAGLSGQLNEYSCPKHSFTALRLQGDATFNGIVIGGVREKTDNFNNTWPIFCDNQEATANALLNASTTTWDNDITYQVPGYPDPTGGQYPVDPWTDVYGKYNVALEGLSWNVTPGSYLKEGDPVEFTASVRNTSSVNIPENGSIPVRFLIDGKTSVGGAIKGAVAAGEVVKVTATAKWSATIGKHTIVATVDPNDRLKEETNENDNSREKTFNVYEDNDPNKVDFTPVTGGYDLVVTKVTYDKETIAVGDNLVFTATVANAGDQPVPAGTKIGVQFQFDGSTYATGLITWCDNYNGGIASHQKVELTANGGGGTGVGNQNYWTALTGSHTITAWVDDQNLLAEVDETNNKATLNLDIPYNGVEYAQTTQDPDDLDNPGRTIQTTTPNGDTPDPDDDKLKDLYNAYNVKLEGLRWDVNGAAAGSEVKEGDDVTFSASIRNTSNVDIPAGIAIPFTIVVNGTTLSGTYTSGIKAGEKAKVSPTQTWKAVAGTCTAVATVDPKDVLPHETDEADNSRQKIFNVIESSNAGSYTAVTGGYDLVVTKVSFDNSAIAVGDNVVFKATVVNAGDTAIPAGTVIGAQFQVDGNTSVITWSDTFKNGLAAHESVVLTANGGTNGNSWTATNGNHSITAWVDDVNRIGGEVNEDNNKTTMSLGIPYAGVSYVDNPDAPDNLDDAIVVPTSVDLVDGEVYAANSNATNVSVSYTRNFKNTNWQPLYVPFRMSYDDWKDDFEVAKLLNIHSYDTNDDGEIDDIELEVVKIKRGTLRENHPYIIKAKQTGSKTIKLTNANVYAATSNTLECASTEHAYKFVGVYQRQTGFLSKGCYVMGGGNLNVPSSDNVAVGSYRWYMQIEDKESQLVVTPVANAKIVVVDSDDDSETTGINVIEERTSTSDSDIQEIYDASGIRQQSLRKGLNIIKQSNGKTYKLFVK